MKGLCNVYKSHSSPEIFIYVRREEGLSKVPEDLLAKFGQPVLAVTFMLTPDRKLATESAEKVIQSLEQKGYHLQMPPLKKAYFVERG